MCTGIDSPCQLYKLQIYTVMFTTDVLSRTLSAPFLPVQPFFLFFSLSLSFFFLSSSPFNTSLIFCGKFGSPYLGKVTAAARAALPISISVRSIFVCPNNGMATSVWDF